MNSQFKNKLEITLNLILKYPSSEIGFIHEGKHYVWKVEQPSG